MIIEEARDILQEQIDRYGQEYDTEVIEALEVAIKALEATDPSRFAMAKIQPNEDYTSEEEVTDIILSIARNLERICEVIRNDKGRS